MKKSDYENLKFLSTICAPSRLEIILSLKKSCCVGQLWQNLNLSQNLTSHHLKVLKKEKLVNSRRQGKKIIYCLDKKVLEKKLKKLEKALLKNK